MMPREPRENFSLDDEGSAWQGVSRYEDRARVAKTSRVANIIRKWGRDAQRPGEGKRQ